MPVTFTVANHQAETVSEKHYADLPLGGKSQTTLLKAAARGPSTGFQKLLQSSFRDDELLNIYPSSNGLVYACIHAYNRHHNLVIRPDDVWTSIMSQFSLYVVAREAEMREYFVAHEGKKTLTVGLQHPADFGRMAKEMTELLEANINDKSLKDWILPSFSTTTTTDTIVGAILMMATLKNYFDYRAELLCGLPSVTLAGTVEDWIALRARLEKLRGFGTPEQHPHLHDWADLLTPIMSRFVDAFSAFPTPDAVSASGQEIREFFQRICHYRSGGSGPAYISGWLTYFCAFNEDGKWQLPTSKADPSDWYMMGTDDPSVSGPGIPGEKWVPRIKMADIPPGYGEVEVTLDDNGNEFDCVMVSGSVACEISGEKTDTLSPKTGWWMFIVDEKEKERMVRHGSQTLPRY